MAVLARRSPYWIDSQRTVSSEESLTSGASTRTASRSAFSKRTRRPARSPPACSLVCPGQATTAELPKALKPRTRATRKPPPYDMRRATATMPQAMPSMVSRLRVRLRRTASQAWASFSRKTFTGEARSSTGLGAQGVDGVHRGRAVGRVEGREHGHRAQQREGAHARLPGGKQAGEEGRHGQQVHQAADAVGHGQAQAAAREDHDQGLGEEEA